MIENFSEGEKRWRLTMIERLPRESGKNRKGRFICECGNETVAVISRVKSGLTKIWVATAEPSYSRMENGLLMILLRAGVSRPKKSISNGESLLFRFAIQATRRNSTA